MNDRRDEEILRTFRERSECAIDAVKERYGEICFRIAAQILGDARDCEECVNDAYLRLWDTIPPAQPDSLRAYLFTVVRNLAKSRYRMLSADKRGGQELTALDELLSVSDGFEQSFDARLLSGALNRFLCGLSHKQRIIFVRRYYYGMSVKETAHSVSLSESNVKAILARTRTKLREFLEKEGFIL